MSLDEFNRARKEALDAAYESMGRALSKTAFGNFGNIDAEEAKRRWRTRPWYQRAWIVTRQQFDWKTRRIRTRFALWVAPWLYEDQD